MLPSRTWPSCSSGRRGAAAGGRSANPGRRRPQTRLLERLSTALGTAGFTVSPPPPTAWRRSARACRAPPDVVLVERELIVRPELHVLQEIGRHLQLVKAYLVTMMGRTPTRPWCGCSAFQPGAMDFIPKPFTVLEVILRAAVEAPRRGSGIPSGSCSAARSASWGCRRCLDDVRAGSPERPFRSTQCTTVAWIDFSEGKIVRARSSALDAGSHPVMISVLDWKEALLRADRGRCPERCAPELETSVTHPLARARSLPGDEGERA